MAKTNSFLNNASSFFDKLMKQTYISKSEILALKKMLKKLSESDESYKKLFNRITTISNRSVGKNEANILTEFYETFQKEIIKQQTTTPLPEKVWTTEDYKGIPQGSCIHVKKETANEYQGIWSSMGGTCSISIPKHLCSKTSNLEKIKNAMSEYLRKRK